MSPKAGMGPFEPAAKTVCTSGIAAGQVAVKSSYVDATAWYNQLTFED
jgi:hypothetical protein